MCADTDPEWCQVTVIRNFKIRDVSYKKRKTKRRNFIHRIPYMTM